MVTLFGVILDRVKETSVEHIFLIKKERTKVFWKPVGSAAIQVCVFLISLLVNSL